MKNYMTRISRILLDLLDEKGLDAPWILVQQISSPSPVHYRVSFWCATDVADEYGDDYEVEFTQSELDAVEPQFPLPGDEVRTILLTDFIRAKLEEQLK